MIELTPNELDDAAFLSLAQRIVNGAVSALRVREAYVVQVDNWFDHKWLGWWSWRGKELCVPPFNPNRVRTQRRFVCDASANEWMEVEPGRPLHVRRAGRWSLAQSLECHSKSAAFVWYSGGTATNTMGSLMLYLSGAERYSWYASLKKRGESWVIADECRVTRRELESFEELGRKHAQNPAAT